MIKLAQELVGTKAAALATEKEIRIQLGSLPEEVSKEGTKVTISQGFIAKVENCDARIRAATPADGETEYTLTVKYRPLFQESETEITKEMFESLAPFVLNMQTKDRFQWKGWDIDVIVKDSRPEKVGEVWAEYEINEKGNLPKIPESWGVDANIQDLVRELEEEANALQKAGNVKKASAIDILLNTLGL